VQARLSPEEVWREILRQERTESGSWVLAAPAPAHDDTRFAVWANEKEILVGIALTDGVQRLPGRKPGRGDDAEILFDPVDDGVGWIRSYWGVLHKRGDDPGNPHRDREPPDEVQKAWHQPCPEGHSRACWDVRLKRYRTWTEQFSVCPITRLGCRWPFAWFPAGEIAHALPECPGPWVERNGHKARYHVLSYLGESWCKGRPRFPDELVAGYTRHVTSKGGVVTWDVPIGRTGGIPTAFVEQLSATRRGIRKS